MSKIISIILLGCLSIEAGELAFIAARYLPITETERCCCGMTGACECCGSARNADAKNEGNGCSLAQASCVPRSPGADAALEKQAGILPLFDSTAILLNTFCYSTLPPQQIISAFSRTVFHPPCS